MVAESRRHESLASPAFADAYRLIRGIEEKVRVEFPGAELELVCGSDDVLHLNAYTREGALTDLLDMVEDDLIALEDSHDLVVHLIPLRFEDRAAAASN